MTVLPILALATAVALAGCATERVTVSPSEPHGRLVTDGSALARHIYPVDVLEINGRPIPGPKGVFWLAPGEYTITMAARFDGRRGAGAIGEQPVPFGSVSARYGDRDRGPPGVRAQRLNPFGPVGVIRIEIEEGKDYYIGARVVGGRLEQWEPVVFAVRDSGRGEPVPDPEPDPGTDIDE
jgi:hypothetical protein